MILYNVTINIDENIHDEWLTWMKEVHVPDVLATQCFTEAKICKIKAEEEGGLTYAFQYLAPSENHYNEYIEKHAERLRKDVIEKYANKFAAFRTILEVIDEFKA